jgi:prevent-host-death family protein
MDQVNVHQAKSQLSRLLTRVEEGEEIVIARAGKPVAKLVPHQPARQPRKPGWGKGKIWVAPDFDAPDEQIERDFGLRD